MLIQNLFFFKTYLDHQIVGLYKAPEAMEENFIDYVNSKLQNKVEIFLMALQMYFSHSKFKMHFSFKISHTFMLGIYKLKFSLF